MKYSFLLVVVVAMSVQVALAQSASLSGFVRDAETGETLILANVVVRDASRGSATNSSGYYSIAGIPAGRYAVVASFVGYREARIEVNLDAGERRRLDIELVPGGGEIEELVVTADAEDDEVREIGSTRLQARAVRDLPTVLEPDVFRALQYLPGVKASSDFSSGLYIRGGSPDQTLILLDGNTVYNPTHFFGFFSTFNPDAIKDVRLYKGTYPASFGGRLGSVVDVHNKDGNRRSLDGSLSVGLLASRGLIEGPLKNGSFMLAVRRSTLEPLLAFLNNQDIDGIPQSFYFYDVNGKLNLDLSSNDLLSIGVYGGRDKLRLGVVEDAEIDLAYGNQTFVLDWTHLFSPDFFSTFSLGGSRYSSEPQFLFAGTTFTRENLATDFSVRAVLEYAPAGAHRLKGGFWGGRFLFRLADRFDGEPSTDLQVQSGYASAYAEDRIRFTDNLELQVGLRANYFDASRDFRLEPRLSVEYAPLDAVRLQAGYGRYNQFLTLVTSEVFSGFDVWLTTGENVPPSFGDQYAVGIKTSLPGDLHIDVEAYYRTMNDLFELDPFIADPSDLPYGDLFRFGQGFAYGSELFLERTAGDLSGFVGYTFGITRRRFAEVNEGRYYAPKYDRTHDVSAVTTYRLSRGWRATAAFNYATGQAYTEPLSQYRLSGDALGTSGRNVLITEYNNRRLPPYHRLDVGVAREGGFFGIGRYELQLQLVNVYSRRNVWFYLFEFNDDDSVTRSTVPQIPIPIPNISLTVDF